MIKKTVFITGSTSGIGLAGASELSARGWRVLIHGRTPQTGEAALAELLKIRPQGEFSLILGDLSTPEGVESVAQQVLKEPSLQVLWNNAGLLIPQRRSNSAGWEMQMAVNHLAPAYLTHLLLPLIRQGEHGRILTTSSAAHYAGKINFEDWMDEKKAYRPFKVYAKTKLANILFTRQLAKDLVGTGVTAHCYHPGFVKTHFGQDRENPQAFSLFQLINWVGLTPRQGADTGIFLTDSESGGQSSGQYWEKRRPRGTSGQVNDENVEKLNFLTRKALSLV